MKITCQTQALHDAFQTVGAVVQSRPTRPILANVLLVASASGLEIRATDREIGMRLDVPEVRVEEEGCAALPQGRVSSILHETVDETVSVTADDTQCVITASDSVFRLPTENAGDFPEIPAFDEANSYEFTRSDFVEMVAKTTFAAHKGKHRYALNGVLLVVGPLVVRMVATDGRRLAHIERKAKNEVEGEKSVIVPTKALEQIVKVLSDQDEKIRVSIGENQMVAKVHRGSVSAVLVEGHFPPYDSVIPKNCEKKLEVDRERFFSAVRRAALVTSDESSAVVLRVEAQKMQVSSAAPETGEAKVEVEIDYDGEEVEIGFNPEFLTDFLRVLTEEKVRVEMHDSGSAGIFRTGKDFLYVVMPVSRE